MAYLCHADSDSIRHITRFFMVREIWLVKAKSPHLVVRSPKRVMLWQFIIGLAMA